MICFCVCIAKHTHTQAASTHTHACLHMFVIFFPPSPAHALHSCYSFWLFVLTSFPTCAVHECKSPFPVSFSFSFSFYFIFYSCRVCVLFFLARCVAVPNILVSLYLCCAVSVSGCVPVSLCVCRVTCRQRM